MSRDLSVAKVYFSLLDPAATRSRHWRGLKRAAGFLRGNLGQAIKVRHVPRAAFSRMTTAPSTAAEISRLIDDANNAPNFNLKE